MALTSDHAPLRPAEAPAWLALARASAANALHTAATAALLVLLACVVAGVALFAL